MNRLAVGAFTALAIATVGAFFLIQHLKVTTPLINGYPAPVPAYINPVSGGTCPMTNPRGRRVLVSFRRTRVSFYLQNRPDIVDVEMIRPDGTAVALMGGSGRHMDVQRRRTFTWNGRGRDGQVVPDGVYDIRVRLVQQGRELLIRNQNTGAIEPVTVQTHAPDLVVTGVTPSTVAVPGRSAVTIHYAGNQGLRPRVLIFRRGGTRPVKSYAATTKGGTSAWNGTLAGGRAAPAGTYLIVLRMTDRTCNRVQSPRSAAAAPQAVVTVG